MTIFHKPPARFRQQYQEGADGGLLGFGLILNVMGTESRLRLARGLTLGSQSAA
jgi:hypothetical protein